MLVKKEFNIKPEAGNEAPEFRNMWFQGFFLITVGEEAANLAIKKFPAALRKYTHLISIFADDNAASAFFEEARYCFRSVLMIGLGVPGCGKNAARGVEVINSVSKELSFKVNKHLIHLKSKYGVIPSSFNELIFSGGTSTGYALAASSEIKGLVKSLDPKAQIVDYVSISRGDYPPQMANSVLTILKLMEEGDTLILSYFDREETLKKISI